MKILIILITSLGLVWGNKPVLRPVFVNDVAESDEIQSGTYDSEQSGPKTSDGPTEARPPITTASTTTTNTPVTETSVTVDLTQRLFYANHDDSQFLRKTLDLSGLDLTGRDVMKILHSLNETVLGRVARLDLSHNRLVNLPLRVWPMQLEYSLIDLRLDHNPMYMDDQLNQMNTKFELMRLLSLKKLSMSHCGLTSHVSPLEYPAIQSLDLSYNRLVEVPDVLSRVVTLEHLNLSHNTIGYLSRLSTPLSNLQTLDLSHNKMMSMFDDPLIQLFRLENLHLDHNSLSEVPKLYRYTGSYQPRINVYLSDNQLLCKCDLQDLLDMDRVQVVDMANVTCFDSNHVEHLLANVSTNTKHTLCSFRWETVKEKWTGARQWAKDAMPSSVTIYQSLGWLLFGVTLGLILAYRQRLKKTPSNDVPYNVLSEGATF